MEYEFFVGEIVSILHASKLSKEEGAKALDAAHKEAYVTITRSTCCPYCNSVFSYEEPTVALSISTQCAKCANNLLVISGTVKSKRYSKPSFHSTEPGLYFRFVDSALRERYAAIFAFSKPVELKSKDIFSLCVGADSETVSQNRKSKKGLASVSNLTLNNDPIVGNLWGVNEILHSLQGKTFIPSEEVKSPIVNSFWK